MPTFNEFYKRATGYEPYGYQVRIARDGLPSVVTAPTGTGKTGMILAWLRPNRVASLHVRIKPLFDALRARLSAWAFDKQVKTPKIDELMATISDALALVDFNFSVLRDSGGDLQEYCLLLISLRLYHLLWPSVPSVVPRSTLPPT